MPCRRKREGEVTSYTLRTTWKRTWFALQEKRPKGKGRTSLEFSNKQYELQSNWRRLSTGRYIQEQETLELNIDCGCRMSICQCNKGRLEKTLESYFKIPLCTSFQVKRTHMPNLWRTRCLCPGLYIAIYSTSYVCSLLLGCSVLAT